jgi:hypothetical protein
MRSVSEKAAMKLPITITGRNGDTSTYSSVHEAEMDIEPIDVEQGEYVAVDADGRRLVIEVVMGDVPVFWGLWKTRVKKVRIADPASDNRS